MLLSVYDSNGMAHPSDLTGLFSGQAAFLVGGAPSLLEQNPSLLEQRGLLTFAINNVGTLFRPTCMVTCDDPRCFDLRLLQDPTIMKFMWDAHASKQIRENDLRLFKSMPNTFFYKAFRTARDSTFFRETNQFPWKRNSLFSALYLMYALGIRKIFLAGSDFGPDDRGDMYSAGTELTSNETRWNQILYRAQIQDLVKFKPMFDEYGVELIDTSVHSKLKSAYPTMTLEEACSVCLNGFPEKFQDAKKLPHVSRLFDKKYMKLCLDNEIHTYSESKYLYGIDRDPSQPEDKSIPLRISEKQPVHNL